MDDLQYVIEQLEAIPFSEIAAHAKGARVPKDTVIKIKYGQTKRPQFQTVKKLAEHFRERAA